MTAHIFGAATGSDPERLGRARKRLVEAKQSLWRPRGRCRFTEIQEELIATREEILQSGRERETRHQLSNQVGTLREEIGEREQRVAQLTDQRTLLDRRLALRTQWNTLHDLEDQLAGLPEEDLPTQTVERHAQLLRDRSIAEAAEDAAKENLERARQSLEHSEPDGLVLHLSDEIQGLANAGNEIEALKQQRDERIAEIDARHATTVEIVDTLGPGWTEDRAAKPRNLDEIEEALEGWASRLLASRVLEGPVVGGRKETNSLRTLFVIGGGCLLGAVFLFLLGASMGFASSVTRNVAGLLALVGLGVVGWAFLRRPARGRHRGLGVARQAPDAPPAPRASTHRWRTPCVADMRSSR